MIKSKMKIFLKINYLLSRKIIIHTSMVINEKMGGSEEREGGLFLKGLNNIDGIITLLRMP